MTSCQTQSRPTRYFIDRVCVNLAQIDRPFAKSLRFGEAIAPPPLLLQRGQVTASPTDDNSSIPEFTRISGNFSKALDKLVVYL
ncbi:hypothetical protein CKA32_000748 [Geitlerinema sp. FC II]|nr:hypothetical protein CKA32_000748 [Geitlerinema sp. FC II]